MKKIFLSILAISAVMVSCSKSEVITAPGADSPIEFNPYTGKTPVTRATAADTDTLKKYGFQTYAFIHAPNGANWAGDPYLNKVVTKPADSDTWVYDGNAYWPVTNQLDFVAYGLNAQNEAKTNITEDATHTVITYKVPAVVADQKDLLVADPQKNQAHEGSSKKVTLQFNHMLSRIAFTLVTKNSNPTPVTITKLQLKGKFFTEGQVDLKAEVPAITQGVQSETDVVYDLLPDGSFTSLANADGVQIFNNSPLYELTGVKGTNNDDFTEAEYSAKTFASEEEKAAADALVAANELNSYMMIIPTKGEEGSLAPATVDITYFLPGAGYYDITVPLSVEGEPIAFEARKAYNFKFKVSTNGISFSVNIDGWEENSDDSQEFELS